jgi:hypothetical protein
MRRLSEAAIRQLCEQLGIEGRFFMACLEESVIEVYETEGHLDLANGTILRLRRLQRICLTFEVDVPVAVMLSETRSLKFDQSG